MNSLEKYNEMQESELAERNRIISQNGNSGLNYELEKFNTTINTKDLENNK